MSLPLKPIKDQIPNHYFKNMNNDLFQKLEDEELFEDLDYPLLHSIEKNNDFTIPQNYFEEFEVLVQLKDKKTKALKHFISIAAIGLAVISFGLLFKQNNMTTKPNLKLSSIDFLNDPVALNMQDIDLIDLLVVSEEELYLDEILNEELIEYLKQESELEDLNNLQ